MSRCRNLCWSVAAASTIAAAGCTPEASRYIRFPDLYHPGTAQQQRVEGIVHDPYPLDDMGPPVVGGRPLGYEKPVPEVERANMYDNAMRRPRAVIPGQAWPAPPPSVSVQYPATAPPVVTSPYAAPALPTSPATAPASPFAISTPPATAVPYTATPMPQAIPFQQQRRSPY